MSNVTEILKQKNNFYCIRGVSEEDILLAEKNIGIKFADDYKQYLLEFGCASWEGHELTGLISSERLNVVDVTKFYRDRYNIPDNVYLIENLNIDNTFIWQDSDGIVYQTTGDSKLNKIANSLIEYVNLD